nr:hypothetical protein [uncultured Draconibacterium sp.]
MKKNQAITILKNQINKIQNQENRTTEWTVQTRTYIEKFFGIESKEVRYINKFSFYNYPSGDVELFLNNCIETIENIGLYKKPKTNFLYTIPNWLAMLLFPLMLTIGIAIGNLQARSQLIDKSNPDKSISTGVASGIAEPKTDSISEYKN